MRQSTILLLNGLAIRLGGTASPVPAVFGEPLTVTVDMAKPITAPEVARLVIPFVPGLEPEENVTLGSVGASSWRAAGGEFVMEFWPRNAAPIVTMNPPGRWTNGS